jgi:hypothetical protein
MADIFTRTGAIWILGLSAMSCRTEDAGSHEQSPEVTAAFEALQVPPITVIAF